MPLELKHRALYAAFDRFPSPKGAGTHIARMAETLFDAMQGGLLFTLGGEDLPFYQREGDVEVLRFEDSIPNFLERTLAYGVRLRDVAERLDGSLRLVHFRDPWSALALLRPGRGYHAVYEVNGLPSIELPYTYPDLGPATLEKIRAAELFALAESDRIITPSATIARNIVALGADPARIDVVPNGADPVSRVPERPADAPGRYVLYFGALQPWQGVDVLLRAFARLADMPDLHLVICASARHRHTKGYAKLAERLGVADRVVWRHALRRSELGGWVAHALLSLAPLVDCSRNVAQGCAPLKILESMAFGVPVIASDLPAVREIITDGHNGRLVRADRPADLARAMRVLLEFPEQARMLGANGRAHIEKHFTWDAASARLRRVYQDLLERAIPVSELAPPVIQRPALMPDDAAESWEGSIFAANELPAESSGGSE